MANSIIAGNDFRLIIRAKKSTGAYLADMDLADVEDLRIYLTRAGRSKVLQSYTLDVEGHAVIYVSAGAVTNATYGIEMVGVYGGARLRAHNTSVFTISGHGGGNSGVLNDYYADIVFVINVAATDVYVQNAIEAHNEDEASHPHLLQLIEDAGDVDDVQIDGESIVDENKIAKIDSSRFGKVDDVKVNGTSVVSNKEANITIPEKVSDLPNDADYATKSELTTGLDAKQDTISAVAEPTIADDGGNPSASVDFNDGEMAFAFKNLKLRFSDLTPEERATLKGDKGDQGDSAVYDPSSPDAPDFEMANTTGQSTTKAMTQKAVTDELRIRPKSSDDENNLLSICDSNGNIIAKINGGIEVDENGNIKTSAFNSEDIAEEEEIDEIKNGINALKEKASISEDDEDNLLSLCDSDGNIIAKINSHIVIDQKGNVKTEAFDSTLPLSPQRSYFPKLDVKKEEFRWLDIGNSHSLCALSYLRSIAISQDVDLSKVAFVRASRGGSSFKSWWEGYHDQDTSGEGDALTGGMYDFVKEFGNLDVTVSGNTYTEPNGTPTAVVDRKLSQSTTRCWGGDCSIFRSLLADNKFDLITIHQRYVSNVEYDSSNGWRDHSEHGYLTEYIRLIKTLQPQATIAVLFSLLPWEYGGGDLESVNEMYSRFCGTMKKFMADTGIDLIIPCDTALENLRNSSVPDEDDEGTGASEDIDSRYGFHYDGAHTTNGVVAYTMSATAWEMILAPRYGKSILGNTYRELIADDISYTPSGTNYLQKVLQGSYTDSNNNKQMIHDGVWGAPAYIGCTSSDGGLTWDYSGRALACMRVSDENAGLCQIAAILAVNDWWHINTPDNVVI